MDSSSATNDRTAEFVALWTASSRQVYSFILSLLPHWADAEEAFQETSRVLWEKFGEFEPGTNFTSWACRVAYFKVQDVRHKANRGPLAFSDAFMGAVEEELAERQEPADRRYAAMLDCIEKLSERDRDLVRRRYQPQATTKSIAAEQNRTVHAVYKALNRIHAALFDCIERTLAREERS